jgi:hypothetical protein
VVLGRIHDVMVSADSRIASATLTPIAWLRGVPQRKPFPITLYTVGATEGLVSLWLLIESPDGGQEETYPYLRREPETWPHLPQPLGDELFKVVPQATGKAVRGLRLRIMAVPAAAGRPLEVWLGLENLSRQRLRVQTGNADSPGTVRFEVVDPDGVTVSVPLLRDRDLRALTTPGPWYETVLASGLHLVSRPPASSAVPTQIVLAESAKPGRYRVRARVTVPGSVVGSEAVPLRDEAALWFGDIGARLTVSVKGP